MLALLLGERKNTNRLAGTSTSTSKTKTQFLEKLGEEEEEPGVGRPPRKRGSGEPDRPPWGTNRRTG